MASSSKTEDDCRHYDNPFPEFSEENAKNLVDLVQNDVHEDFKKELKIRIESFLLKLESNAREWSFKNDQTIYTGNAGIAYLYYLLGKNLNKPAFTCWAMELLEKSPSDHNSNRKTDHSFLMGQAGRLVLITLLRNTPRDEANRIIFLAKLTKMWHHLGSLQPDEILYGRAGYLYALLLAKKNISSSSVKDRHIKRLAGHILAHGISYSKPENCESPLMYCWHGKEYLGGAHGLSGILYMLLQAREFLTKTELTDYVETSIRYLMSIRFPSGNFPSSLGNENDKLVHWCHGAPSMTMLFTLAHEVFGKDEYLEVAKECAEVVWKRGLLKKGCGICHGVAGNAYSFLCLFNYTKDPRYLYRACKFAEWCFDYELHQNRIPDRPYSLFEGLAGIIYFLADLLNPSSAKFPGYEV